MTMCNECAKGPTGQGGHDGLFTHSMANARMQFKCGACGTIWMRHQAGDNAFTWVASNELEKIGVQMPGPAR